MHSPRIIIAALAALALASSEMAAQSITPSSYTVTPGEGRAQNGTWDYFDVSGRELIDGIIGADQWYLDLGAGHAAEWVGWRHADPFAEFLFSSAVHVDRVSIGFNYGVGYVGLPLTVVIEGQSHQLTGTEIPFGSRGFISFDTDFTGNRLGLSILDHSRENWIFVDEVRFEGRALAPTVGPVSGNVTPEPISAALVGTGLLGVLVVARRRRRASGVAD